MRFGKRHLPARGIRKDSLIRPEERRAAEGSVRARHTRYGAQTAARARGAALPGVDRVSVYGPGWQGVCAR